MARMGRQWILARKPAIDLTREDFALEEFPLEPLGEGLIQVRLAYHTIAPGVRAKLTGKTYAAGVQPGDPIPGMGIGIVEASNNPAFAVGDHVAGSLNWGSHCITKGDGLQPLDAGLFEDGVPLSTGVDTLGMAGLTAYFGLHRIGEIRSGTTVLISAAAGMVGTTAGQIAKIRGCRVVGIASSTEKCRELVEKFGFDAAISYRNEPDLRAAIARECPEGVDLYYDNVGGETTDAALLNMNRDGRVVIGGQLSDRSLAEPRGIRTMMELVTRRLRLEGFVVVDFAPDYPAARAEMAAWIRDGRLKHEVQIVPGLEHSVDAFLERIYGSNKQRSVVKIEA